MTLLLALAFLLISGAVLSFALLISRRARLGIEQRIGLVHAASGRKIAVADSNKKTFVKTFGTRLREFFSLGVVHDWGMSAGTTLLLAIGSLGAFAGYMLAVLIFGRNYWIAVPGAVACFMLFPRLLLSHQQGQAEKKFMNLFPDAIDMVVRMLRAGLPITSAVRAIGNDAPAPINSVFRTLADQVEIGMPFDEALIITGARVGVPDFRFFAVAVALQRATGGNLAETLEILSDIMRKRRAVRLKAQATTAEVRVSAYILGALPFLVVGALLIVQPGYLAPLVTDPRGKVIVGAATISLIMAYTIMSKMMRSAIRI